MDKVKGSEDLADFRALMLSMFPLMANYSTILGLVEYYGWGNAYLSMSLAVYLVPLVFVLAYMFFHTYRKLKEIKMAYKAYSNRRKEFLKITTIIYWLGSFALMFGLREAIVAGII